MNEASFAATAVIVFREALEASLIVGIILTVLVRLKARRYFPHVGLSTAAAIIASIFAGFWLHSLTSSLQVQYEAILAGTISLLACGVLTYMIFWMDQQARALKSEIETQVESALNQSEVIAILLLPFFAVLREGAETVLFLKALSLQATGMLSLTGALAGLLVAVMICVLIFAGGRKIPLKPLFRWTGGFILLIAAGLLAYGIHELQEVGWVPFIVEHVWDINNVLNEKVGVGAFLKALFGYNGNPSLIEVVAYGGYILAIMTAIRKRSLQKA